MCVLIGQQMDARMRILAKKLKRKSEKMKRNVYGVYYIVRYAQRRCGKSHAGDEKWRTER